MKLNCKAHLVFMGAINMSGSVPGKERPGQAAARGASCPCPDEEQTMPGEPKTRDLVQAPLPLLLQRSCHSMGRRGPWAAASPSCNPSSAPIPRGLREQHVPLLSHVQSKGTGGREGEMFPCLFLGGDILRCMVHTCPGGSGSPELQRRVTLVSAQLPRSPAWLQISSFIVVIANASTAVKIKLLCAEIRPRPSPTLGRKGMGGKEPYGSFLSQGCRGERDGKYKETSWGFR